MSELNNKTDASAFKPKGVFDVEYKTDVLETDEAANRALKNIGKNIHKEEGLTYVGSIAAHIYTSDVDKLQLKLDFGSVNQICLGEVAQNVVQIAWQNLGIELAKSFGHQHRTRNTNDKR